MATPCQDISVYLSDIRDLFHLPTEEEYTSKLASMKQKWSAPFSDYYTNQIHPDVHSIARWAIESYGVYHPYSGVTNNQSESLNHVLKQLQEWCELPLDCMILALNHLQSYYKVEIVPWPAWSWQVPLTPPVQKTGEHTAPPS